MDDPLVVPDGLSVSPEKLEPLAQVLDACWAEVVAKQPGLDDPQRGPFTTEPNGLAHFGRSGSRRG
jgi:hypothetical protein